MPSCAVVFDVDGVLLDSLEPHLRICADKNVEYGLGLTIPKATEFRTMVRAGVKISPMKSFFQAVGFPPHYADLATTQYNETFMRKYAPKPFSGVADMLSALSSTGFHLGIATSNVRSNIDSALGPSMRFFDPECVFTKDHPVGSSKTAALRTVATQLNIPTSLMIFVGDQPADWAAAKESGANFLGVTYGWGISSQDAEFPLATNVPDIPELVMNICATRQQPQR